MKTNFLKIIGTILLCSFLFTSCYTYTTVVGDGPQKKQEEKIWNHYFIYGLVPGTVSDPNKMADGAENYTVTTKHTFLNGLVGVLTLGIYTPTETTVYK